MQKTQTAKPNFCSLGIEAGGGGGIGSAKEDFCLVKFVPRRFFSAEVVEICKFILI